MHPFNGDVLRASFTKGFVVVFSAADVTYSAPDTWCRYERRTQGLSRILSVIVATLIPDCTCI